MRLCNKPAELGCDELYTRRGANTGEVRTRVRCEQNSKNRALQNATFQNTLTFNRIRAKGKEIMATDKELIDGGTSPLNSLTSVYREFLNRNGLPQMSAGELLLKVDEGEIIASGNADAFLRAFTMIWDEVAAWKPAEVSRHETEPTGPLPKARKGLVTGHFIERDPLPAYFREQLWNGWAEPYFERDVLLAGLKTEPGLSNVTYDEKGDQFVAFMGSDPDKVMTPEEREEMTERYPAQQIETSDGVKTVYALGASSWCWEEYSEGQPPEVR